MFERYTEKARRVIFFARYEASQFGNPYIETEHLLLGLLREDKALRRRLMPGMNDEAIRRQIEAVTTKGEQIPTSVDLPLSQECKRVLEYAADEAEQLKSRDIGTEHLLLGLLREEKSLAAQLLLESGLRLGAAREAIKHFEKETSAARTEPAAPAPVGIDLSQRAAEGLLRPFVDRDKEMESLVLVLGRSDKNSAALVGEPGVGRRSLAEGLVQRIADGNVPSLLAERILIEVDAALMLTGRRPSTEEFLKKVAQAVPAAQRPLLLMEDLLPILASPGAADAAVIIKPLLLDSRIQCISIATPQEWTRALEACGWLDRCFRRIDIEPMSPDAATEVVSSAKERFEKFHGVVFTADALQCAVLYSSIHVKDRHLPGKALDLLDEAAAYVNIQSRLPDEVLEQRKKIRFIGQRLENAIANHEFEKARFYSDEERKERAHLEELLKKHNLTKGSPIEVTQSEIEEVLARWTGIPVSRIRESGSGSAKTDR